MRLGFAGKKRAKQKTSLMQSSPKKGRNGIKMETNGTFTIVFLQKSNDLFQHGGFVHFPRIAREHGAKFFDENIELVPTLLLRLVSRSSEAL